MGTDVLTCPGVRANEKIFRMIGSELTPPPTDVHFPSLPSLVAVLEETEDEVFDLFIWPYYSRFFRITRSLMKYFSLLKRITLRRLSIDTPCSNLPW